MKNQASFHKHQLCYFQSHQNESLPLPFPYIPLPCCQSSSFFLFIRILYTTAKVIAILLSIQSTLTSSFFLLFQLISKTQQFYHIYHISKQRYCSRNNPDKIFQIITNYCFQTIFMKFQAIIWQKIFAKRNRDLFLFNFQNRQDIYVEVILEYQSSVINLLYSLMKQFRIVSLSSKGQFIVQDNTGGNFQMPIEGFRVNPSLEFRHYFDDFIGQTIDCTLNKNSTHIRYQNQSFLSQKVAFGAMDIVQKQLQQSKIYTNPQKTRFLAIEKKVTENSFKIVNLLNDRKNILKYFTREEEVVGRLEYFSDEIVIRIKKENELLYVSFRLKNINCMFACLEEAVFAPFFIDNQKLKIKMERPFYNLVQKRFELNGQLQPAVELSILKQGWGILNTSTLVTTSPDIKPEDYLNAESTAKESHLGIFSKNTEILGFIYAKNNFVGEVSDVFDGYVFEVLRKATDERVKIELAMVLSPVGDEVGAFNCREFARKQLIGQEVNVYLHKDSGLNITGSIVRAKDSKDVESLMIEQGWGFVREQFVNSVLCIKLNQLEKRAKQKLRGLHSKEVGVFRPEDLTVPNNQKQEFYVYRRLQILKKLGENEVGVLEGMIDTLTYRVWIEDKNIVLKVKLEGILGHNINPQLEQVKTMKEQLKNIYQRKMKKRSINVSITNYQKEGNNFIGTICFAGGQSLQELLLEGSYVYADKQNGTKEIYRSLEDKARSGKKGVWSPNLVNFEPINPLDLQSQRFKGKFSWIDDGQTVFIQPENKIAIELSKAKIAKAKKEELAIGAIYAAPYDGDLYRALITSIKGKKVKVLFIDWGNRETVDEGDLWQLPESLKFIEKQAIKAKLYLTKPLKNEQYLQRLRGELMDGDECQFRREKGQYVACYRNKQNINLSLIEKGLVKGNSAMATQEMRRIISQIERNLCKNRIGVWEWSDEDEKSDNDSFQDD